MYVLTGWGNYLIFIYLYMYTVIIHECNQVADCLDQDKNVQLPLSKDTIFSLEKPKAKTCGPSDFLWRVLALIWVERMFDKMQPQPLRNLCRHHRFGSVPEQRSQCCHHGKVSCFKGYGFCLAECSCRGHVSGWLAMMSLHTVDMVWCDVRRLQHIQNSWLILDVGSNVDPIFKYSYSVVHLRYRYDMIFSAWSENTLPI